MPKTKPKEEQLPLTLDPDDDAAYQAFLNDLADHPPPVTTATVKRWRSHKERPCKSPKLEFVEVLGLKGRKGYIVCAECGMFHEWVVVEEQ